MEIFFEFYFRFVNYRFHYNNLCSVHVLYNRIHALLVINIMIIHLVYQLDDGSLRFKSGDSERSSEINSLLN